MSLQTDTIEVTRETAAMLRGCLETKPLYEKTSGHMRGKAKNGLAGQSTSSYAFRDF
jgi:hypothetical protein